MIGWKSREITFQQYRENLAKAGVFRWVTNIHEHKRYYYTFDNSLLFTGEHSEHYTNLSTLNHNVRFLPCQHRGVGIMQYVRAKPCVHRFNYSLAPPVRSVPRQGCGHIREYNDDSSHLTYINKY